jgi:putative membrane fusion protein
MNKQTKKLVLYVLAVLFLSGLLFYIAYHALSGASEKIETVSVRTGSYSKTLDAEAYIFRNEELIMRKNGGAVDFALSSGERMAVGQVLARIYSNSQSEELLSELKKLDESISLLQKSIYTEFGSVVGADEVEDDIKSLMTKINTRLYFGELDEAQALSIDLLVKMNKHLQMTTSGVDIASEIARLSAERESVELKLGLPIETVKSEKSGYFYSYVDGYEDIFTIDALSDITLDSFDKLVLSEPRTASEYCIGKAAYDYEWYFAAKTSVKLVSRYLLGQSYEVEFLSCDTPIKATLEKIVSESSKDSALLVFRADRIPEDFDFRRCQNISILGDEYSGLKIPENSLRIVDGVSGVYILYGNTVHFRTVEVLGEAEGYYYISRSSSGVTVNADDGNEKNDIYYAPLKEYDRVITYGVGLYDGKVIK